MLWNTIICPDSVFINNRIDIVSVLQYITGYYTCAFNQTLFQFEKVLTGTFFSLLVMNSVKFTEITST